MPDEPVIPVPNPAGQPTDNLYRAKVAAQKIIDFLTLFQPVQNNPFASVGPSDEFLNTHLPASVATPEQVGQVVAAIEKAVRNNDINKINQILGIATSIMGPLKSLIGFI